MTDPTEAELKAAGLDRGKWQRLVDKVHRGNLTEAKLTVTALATLRAHQPKGELMTRNLMQSESWTTRVNDTIALVDMSPGHRTNLLRMLERNAERIKDTYMFSILIAQWPDQDTVAAMFVEADFDDMVDADPIEWLHGLPLVKKLIELGAESGVDHGE